MNVEVYRRRNGLYGWRVRDEDGRLVRARPGRAYLPYDPEAVARSRAAVQEVLRQQYEAAQTADG